MAAICGSARISVRASETGSENTVSGAALASVRLDGEALAKAIEDEAQEKDHAERAKNPIGHRLIRSVDVVSIIKN